MACNCRTDEKCCGARERGEKCECEPRGESSDPPYGLVCIMAGTVPPHEQLNPREVVVRLCIGLAVVVMAIIATGFLAKCFGIL